MGPGYDAPMVPPPNSWADPLGPGRCPRCHLWLDDDRTCVWMVRRRNQAEAFGRVGLCDDCTGDMISWWRVETWQPDPPKGTD